MTPELVLFLCSGNYYRSRFAEELFNARARLRGLTWRATSAGLKPPCQTRHPDHLSPYAREGLRQREIEVVAPRAPVDLAPHHLQSAAQIVVLCEREHRALLERRNPPPCTPVRYWQVEDIDVTSPLVALAEIETNVERLLHGLIRRG